MPPDVPFPQIPGGAYGYPATLDPEMDQTTHQFAGGAGGFPLTFDDGTNTYSITASGGLIQITVTDDLTGDVISQSGLSLGDPVSNSLLAQFSPGVFSNLFAVSGSSGPSYAQLTTDGAAVQLYVSNGIPTFPATLGSVAFDVLTPAIYQNTDGGTAWSLVGGGSGLPPQWTTNNATGEVVGAVNDIALTPLTLIPTAGQTEALLVLQNEAAGEAIEGFTNGSINQYLVDPAVVGWLVKMAPNQTASPLKIVTDNNNAVFDFDPVNGNIQIQAVESSTIASTNWYAQAFTNFSESDLSMSVGGTIAFEFDTFVDNNDATNNYTHLDIKTQPSQSVTNPVLRQFNTDESAYVLTWSTLGAITMREQADPAAPAANYAVFYTKDDGAGNTQFVVQFSDGSVRVLATAGTISSNTATAAFGALAVGTPKQNTLGYDVLISGTITVTAATAGSLKLGVGPSATPTTDPITEALTTAALLDIAFSAIVPNNYYISLQSSGTITLGSPVVIASPV